MRCLGRRSTRPTKTKRSACARTHTRRRRRSGPMEAGRNLPGLVLPRGNPIVQGDMIRIASQGELDEALAMFARQPHGHRHLLYLSVAAAPLTSSPNGQSPRSPATLAPRPSPLVLTLAVAPRAGGQTWAGRTTGTRMATTSGRCPSARWSARPCALCGASRTSAARSSASAALAACTRSCCVRPAPSWP